jgi:acyl carrier protein phosphodiesterase
MYLKFLTPLTPSVGKIMNLHWFKEVYKPRNMKVLFSHCVIMAWQCVSPEVTVQSFKKCCISSAVNGTDDDMFWH